MKSTSKIAYTMIWSPGTSVPSGTSLCAGAVPLLPAVPFQFRPGRSPLPRPPGVPLCAELVAPDQAAGAMDPISSPPNAARRSPLAA